MRRECLDDVWDELRQCIAFFDLRGISDEDVEDILTQKFQLLNASHKDETYSCLDALPTTRLERTALCFARVLDLIQTSPSMSNKFWKTLSKVVDKRAMHRTVLATIDLCMSKVSALAKVTGSAPTDDQSPLSKGLLAAKVYLMWLHIPGGSAYSIFMPFVYQDALWVLLGWAKVMYAPELEEQASKTARAGQTKRKQAKKPSYVASTELAEYGKDVLTILVSLGSMQSFNLDAVTSTLDAIVSIAALMAVQAVPAEECRQILKALYPNHAQQVLVRLMPALAFRDKSLPGGARDTQQHMTAFHVWSLETSDQLLGSHGNDDANAMNAMVVLQQLCIRSPEKTDYRKKVAAALVTLFFHHVLPHPGYTSTLMTFLDSFSRSEKVTCRQFAVEVTTQLIVHDGWTDQFSLQFGILMRRARDRSVWVRNKALVGMASVLSKALHKQASGWSPALEQVVVAELTSSKSFSDETPPIRVWTHLIQLLQMCLEDGKKMVRKSALQVLEVLLVVERDMGIVAEIQLKCTDSSVLVRKQAMHVLTTLVLKDPSNRDLHNIWSWGVLPLVNDPEPMVQTSCVDFVDQVLFQRLGEWHDYRRRGLEITHALECVHDQFDHLDRMLITFAQVALRLLVKAGKIDVPQVIKNCIAGIQIPETTTSSWVVLDELHARLIDHVTTSDCRVLTKMWNEKQDQNSLRMLRVLSSIASRVAALDASKIAKRLQVALQSFSFHMNVIPGAIHTLVRLQDDKSWQTSLWAACDEVIQDVVTNGVQDISRLQRVLCTMGDLWDGQHDQPQRLQHIQRFLLPTFNQQSTPSAVRAVAFLALGKVSLASQSIAKDSMTMFIRELQTSDNVAIRSNILLVLGDLCMQYTSMVEVYVPTIAACFMNPDVLLRRNVLLMLTQLILQGYIKWKDSLLHYFLHLVVDDDAELAHLARHVLSGPLLQKTPHLFTTKFVETIFVLNNVILPSVSAVGLVMSDAEVHALSFCGADLFPNRWKIYHFMLNTMSDFQKVDVTGKLTRGILEEVSEQKLPLHDNAKDIQDNSVERVVQDTLLVLSSSEIKLTHGGAGDDDDELEPSSMKEATRKLASKLSKKNLMVNVIPVVIGVKHQLEAKRSPVMRYLLHYIQDLMTSFKEEVMDVLNTDPQLAKEIAFDLKQYKAMKLAKSRPSLGGGPAVLPGASIVPLGVTSTPLLKKHMTPLTRILRERRASFNDYSDDEGVTKTLDFSAMSKQRTSHIAHIHIAPLVESVPVEEAETGTESSSDSDFEAVEQKPKKALVKRARRRAAM